MMKVVTEEIRVLKIDEWKTPASSYPRRQVGDFRISDHIYRPGRRNYYGIDGIQYFDVEKPITITTLEEWRDGKWNQWMTDSPTDYRAMQKYAKKAKGKVLTTGLGLGLFLVEALDNRDVNSISVVEKSSAVGILTGNLHRFSEDCNYNMDFLLFLNAYGGSFQYDYILVDLWTIRGESDMAKIYLNEVLPLKAKLRELYPGAIIDFYPFADATAEQVKEAIEAGTVQKTLWGVI